MIVSCKGAGEIDQQTNQPTNQIVGFCAASWVSTASDLFLASELPAAGHSGALLQLWPVGRSTGFRVKRGGLQVLALQPARLNEASSVLHHVFFLSASQGETGGQRG